MSDFIQTITRIVSVAFQTIADPQAARRQAYLSEASDLADLERRQKELSREFREASFVRG